jgi:UDP-N-acetylglucosamine enolpyruvyl transferase
MLDLVKLMPHLTPSRLWKGTQIVECAATVFAIKQTEARITELTARLIALEREGADVVAEINTLRSMRSEETEPIKVAPSGRAGDPTDLNSPIEKKHALFRGLFCGRSDVYPTRWENGTTWRSGYAPPARMNGAEGFAKNQESNV